MSKGQTISRLEALLARVRTRAAEPRPVATVIAAAPATIIEAPPIHAAPVAEAAAARDAGAPPVGTPVFELEEPVEELETTQSRPVPQRAAPMVTETDIVMEVEVQTTTQETVLAVPVEEAVAPEPTESRERLVAAEPVSAAPAPEGEAPPVVAIQVVEEQVEEISLEPAVEEAEEAPVSSRRPVAPPPEERLEEMAFGSAEPEPPRHTPPPESGRLPAAPEPELEFDGDITGVRSATKSAHPAPPAAVALLPEATIAELAPSEEVADVVGTPQAPVPTTFLGVLDQSLAL